MNKHSRNLLFIWFGEDHCVGVRLYRYANRWGWRYLGKTRWSLDMGRFSILFENYAR